ncbi:MAG: DnaJ domain-containing protein [Cyanobacteria bacterium J06560_6]
MTTPKGLFQLDMTDHHAVLGFSLAAAPKQVRKRYLKVARQLHPDSLREASDEQRKLASELLSKRVNPAYETLTQDKLAKEHKILLKMKQQQLSANPSLVTIDSDIAKGLLDAKDVETAYEVALKEITASQFNNLSQVDTVIDQISELNAVYLMCKQPADKTSASQSNTVAASQTASQTATQAKATDRRAVVPKRSHSSTIIQSYLRRAEEFASQQDYSRGILELREAIASHPKNARCHAELANLYHKSGQATLARIHAKQALVFDPDNQTAKAVQARLEKANGKQKANGPKKAKNAKGAKKGKEKGGGLLSGLFGGKKR